jgi:hypothetical protein
MAMLNSLERTKRRDARNGYWLAGQFSLRPHPFADRAVAAWSEFMGREAAVLWVAAKAHEGRGR